MWKGSVFGVLFWTVVELEVSDKASIEVGFLS
jgi:hypothetical protein